MSDKKEKAVKQSMLTALFLAVMLAGFGAIAYVEYDYAQTTQPIQLFVSDDNTVFPVIPAYTDYNGWYSLRNAQYERTNFDGLQTNKTAVYAGNNTYVMSIDIMNTLFYKYATYVIELPELDNWLITSINLTTTLNIDTDLRSEIYIHHHTGDYDRTNPSHKTIVYQNNGEGGAETYKEKDIAVPLSKAVEVYDGCQNQDVKALEFMLYDKDQNGFGAFSWEFSIEIHGEILSGWSSHDTVVAILVISGTANILIALVMTDGLDIGGYVRNLPKRRK